ncbi:MAG: hypothetical protein WC781_04035 [Candidatus Pacearchaeota archaeon]|jgi:hypothetical protein
MKKGLVSLITGTALTVAGSLSLGTSCETVGYGYDVNPTIIIRPNQGPYHPGPRGPMHPGPYHPGPHGPGPRGPMPFHPHR